MFSRLKFKSNVYKINEDKLIIPVKSEEETPTPSRLPIKEALKKCYYGYCESTSIHGIQYLGDRERPLIEKFFWICIFSVFVYCCSNLISNVWNKWDETPVIVSFSEKSTPVWEIPFPAVTICSESKEMKQNEYDFTKFYNLLLKNWSEDGNIEITDELRNITNFDELRALLQICGNYLSDDLFLPSLKELDYYGIFKNIAIPSNLSLPFCKWRGSLESCENLFLDAYTDEGFCYTFNGLNVSELYRDNTFQYKYYEMNRDPDSQREHPMKWSLQGGYSPDTDVTSFPYRVLGAGSRPGLFVVLQGIEKNMDFLCRGPVQGFKIHLHSPDDVPMVSNQYVVVPFGKEVLISVKPSMITTSDGIINYTPEGRQCYFNNERYLKYFNIYTQKNCESECLSNYTLKHCGCVKFSMPRTEDMKVCNETSIKCYDEAEDELLKVEFSEGLIDSSFNHRGRTKCHCLPACTSLSYNTEISQADFDLINFVKSSESLYEYYQQFEGLKMSRLVIFFKESQFITSKRSELFGLTDFLANCGGLLGLFSGFSFLSMIELFYHCTIRLYHNMRVH